MRFGLQLRPASRRGPLSVMAGCILALCVWVGLGTSPSNAGGLLGDLIQRAVPKIQLQGDVPASPAQPRNIQERATPLDVEVLSRASLPPIEAFPWAVALAPAAPSNRPLAICVGVAVASEWVLTTAHCATFQPTGRLEILVGHADLTRAARLRVLSVVVHPAWISGQISNDLALIKVEPQPGVRLLPAPQPLTSEVRTGAIGQVVGWGATNYVSEPSTLLQLLQVRVISPEVCGGPSGYLNLSGAQEFCAQSIDWLKDACQGFGGGPVVMNDGDGRRYIAGIVSRGSGCPPESSKPTIYTALYPVLNWVKATTGAF